MRRGSSLSRRRPVNFYIRLAGVDEAGATEILRFVPTEEAVMEKVVSMYDHKRKD
jgi:ribulose bisphosphate carboxylase small subunit